MGSTGDKKLPQPTSDDEQNMPVSNVKEENLLTQTPGEECPVNTSMPREADKRSEQDGTAHATDDTKVEFTIKMVKKKKRKEEEYMVCGKPNESLYTTLMKKETFKDEQKNRPKKKMKLSTGETPKVYVNLGMPLKCLPKDSKLHMTFVKSGNNQNDEPQYNKSIDRECFTFDISGEGREKKRIVELNYGVKSRDYLRVYGVKGETICDALCNDGRFLSWVTENNWVLVKEGVKYLKDTLVETVAGGKFEVIVERNRTENPQKEQEQKDKKMSLQQNSSSEDQTYTVGTSQKGAQSTTVEGEFLKPEMAKKARKPVPSKCKPKKSQWYSYELHILKIYKLFKKENEWIQNFFETELENVGKRGNELFNLHREKFGKVTEDAMTSKSFKTLAMLADSVGYISLTKNGRSTCGTCFVFWDRYILTCRHVLEEIIYGVKEKEWAQTISENSFVTFTDENPKHSPKIFGIEPWFEVSSTLFDYAVLKLKENEIPKGLFKQKQNTELPWDGNVFIIGHPEGEVKKIDICTVIPQADREKNCQTVLQDRQKPECNATNCPDKEDRCIHMFSVKDFTEGDLMNCPSRLTYHTSFFCGSSGSPVLDASGRLIAMHAAGYKYNYQGQKQSLIEYGFSMDSIHNDMKQNHVRWYNSLFPYQCDVEMVSPSDSPTLISKEVASRADCNLRERSVVSQD